MKHRRGIAALIGVILAVGELQAATAIERTSEDCANEILLFCAERKDIQPCLREQIDSLTPRCRDAVGEPHLPKAPPRPSTHQFANHPAPSKPCGRESPV